MKHPDFKDIFRHKMPDVRPLNHRENKMDLRKGMLPAENERKSIKAIVQMPLFGDPYKKNDSLNLSDDFLPDYVKKYILNPEK